MGILKKVLGGGTEEGTAPEVTEVGEPECPHTALVNHWDDPADMGKAEKATYICDACGQTFTYEQAQEFLNQPPAPLVAAGKADETR
jgi:hypothetical protein